MTTTAPSQPSPQPAAARKIMVSAGEVSGDQHAARIVRSLADESERPLDIRGMGGPALLAEGMQLTVDLRKSGGLNGLNIPLIIWKSLSAMTALVWLLFRWKPEVLVIVDYPDFNIRLAKVARLLGIPVVYFIPPKAWAWRTGRVKTLRKWVNGLALIFPFEREFYQRHKHPDARYVGHPFAHEFKDSTLLSSSEKQAFISAQGLDPKKPVIALLPGSRKGEVSRLLSTMLEAARIVRAHDETVQVLIPIAPSIPDSQLSSLVPNEPWIATTRESSSQVMQVATAGMLKSGTNNMEAAFLGLPFTCCYILAPVSAFFARRFVKLKEYSLVNIIRSGTAKEFMQEAATPEALAKDVLSLLQDDEYRKTQIKGLQEVVSSLQTHEAHPDFTETSTPGERTSKMVLHYANYGRRSRQGFARLIRYLRSYKKQFVAAFFAMIIYGATDGGLPFLIKHILDGVFAEQNRDLLGILPIFLICYAIFRAVADFFQSFLTARIGHHIVRDIRNELSTHLLSLPPSFFVRCSVASLLSRFTSDVVLVRTLLTDSLTSVIRDSIRIVALLCAAVYLDPFLALLSFVIFPLAIIPVYQFGRRMRKLSKRGQEAIGSLSTIVQEASLGSKVVKIFDRQEYEQEKFSIENERLTSTFVKSEFVKSLTSPVNELLASFAISGVILYGGFSVMNGTRSQGEFIAFLTALFLMYDPFKKISKLNNNIQQGLSGADRIFELLDETIEVENTESSVPLPTDYTVEFEHVTFTHEGAGAPALRDIHVKIPHGAQCALVGFSGAGKTTMVDLLPRFITPQEGDVRIGGVSTADLSLRALRGQIAMVGQHTFLFNDTIYNNIAYGKPDASEEEVMKAAKDAFAFNFVNALPNGFSTIVGEAGMSLSGGERQRIAIARALLKDAPLLILDEATASLDNKAEREVQQALERLLKDRTSLVIAHRLSTIRNADLILVLEEGQIVEAGTHDELLQQEGAFAHLHDLQFRSNDQEERLVSNGAH